MCGLKNHVFERMAAVCKMQTAFLGMYVRQCMNISQALVLVKLSVDGNK